jgi:hypothetical protein
LVAVSAAELIVLVAQIFPGVPQQQTAMFYLARCKHELENDEARMTDDETMTKLK